MLGEQVGEARAVPDLDVRSFWYATKATSATFEGCEIVDNSPDAMMSVSKAPSVDMSFGMRLPGFKWPIAMATAVQGLVEVLPYSAVGDGSIGLSPLAAYDLVQSLHGKEWRSLTYEGSQLLLSLIEKKLEFHTYNWDNLLWFGLDTDDPRDHWAVRSKRPPSEKRPSPDNGGQVQFATHHRNTMLAHNLVDDYFDGWPLLHTERDPSSGMRYVSCDAGRIAPPLELQIENNIFVVLPNNIIGPPAPAYRGIDPGIRWCKALIQEISEDVIVKSGVWLSLGYVA